MRSRAEGTAPPEQKPWIGVVTAVGATALIVVGVVVVAGGNHTDEVADPAVSAGATDLLPSDESSRVSGEESVFGGTFFQVTYGLTVGGPGVVAVGRDGSAAVWVSVDGLDWSRVAHDEAVFGGDGGPVMMGVYVGGPGVVAVGGIFIASLRSCGPQCARRASAHRPRYCGQRGHAVARLVRAATGSVYLWVAQLSV